MNYVDLGLPSGTLWADTNEEGYYTFDEAKEKYKDSLPTKEQWKELIDNCVWLWDVEKNQMVVTGNNGNKIVIPADGYPCSDGLIYCEGSDGHYWSSSLCMDYSGDAYYVLFDSCNIYSTYDGRYHMKSVRLIKNK